MINPLRMVGYAAWIAKEIMVGAVDIAKDALTPGVAMDPAIVELPLRCRTDLEVSLMASSITITPGTVTLGVAPGDARHPPTLFVHAIYGSDPDEVLQGLRDMEDRLLAMTRGRMAERSPR
ncbi:Na+/H+ antiporter subunit E [Ornithinimicrobium sufpigmenti]|uniref:Na+/H+ antiporter subunit E n=1 Tax=Ornithinimicrobium sufpigmenti TaxID=2508882 RepID=UPI001EDFA63A|nr:MULTISPECIES: Na+/H+ antiporter subunit E [unclassified Ornithinimicrobium]